MQLIPRKQQRQDASSQAVTLRDAMNQLFEESFWDPFRLLSGPSMLTAMSKQFLPNIDISETEKELHIVADVPGYDPKNVAVNVENGFLTIEGTMEEEKEEKNKKWYRRETAHGNFFQQVALPQGVSENDVKCKMKNGKLSIVVRKPQGEQTKKKSLTIDVE